MEGGGKRGGGWGEAEGQIPWPWHTGDYGFMPVKNATRRDSRVHVAYLTTSSEGWQGGEGWGDDPVVVVVVVGDGIPMVQGGP